MKAKQLILDTLTADTELMAAIKSLSAAWHDEKRGYPQITLTQISNRPVSFSDDRTDFTQALIQIDIWARGNPFFIAEKVVAALAAIDLDPSDEREQNEENINRVILEYRKEE